MSVASVRTSPGPEATALVAMRVSRAGWAIGPTPGSVDMNVAPRAASLTEKEADHATSADPMSHRIIEKRRRDRMNNCLADLSRLIPAEYLKKGRGRIEKTEIIEMAIRHMKHLQAQACRHGDQCNGSNGGGSAAISGGDLSQQSSPEEPNPDPPPGNGGGGGNGGPIVLEHYRLGYHECLSEAMHFLVEVEGFFAGDPLCVQLINHLQRHCERILKGDRLNYPRTYVAETSSSGSSCGSGRGRAGTYGGGGGSINGGSGLGSSGLGSASASGSSPGSCSDSSRTEAPPPPREVGPGRRVGGGGSSNGGCYGDSPPPMAHMPLGSQLRDMLTGSQDRRCMGEGMQCTVGHPSRPMGIGSLPPTGQTVIHPPQLPRHHVPPPPTQPFAPSSLGVSDAVHVADTTPASLYKFKNNIKQRFSAEHLSNVGEPQAYIKRRRYDHDDSGCMGLLTLAARRRDSETCSVPSPPVSPPLAYTAGPAPPPAVRSPGPAPPSAHAPQPPRPVPVFALHARGAYYVPLTLDSDILAPFSDCSCVESAPDTGPVPAALHPVTISVNFTRASSVCPRMAATRHMGACGAVTAPWKTEPIWPQCAPDRA